MADIFSLIFYFSLIPAIFFAVKAIINKKNNSTPYLKKLKITLSIILFSLIGFNFVTSNKISEIFAFIFYISLIPAIFFAVKAIINKKNNSAPYLKKLKITLLITIFSLIGYNMT